MDFRHLSIQVESTAIFIKNMYLLTVRRCWWYYFEIRFVQYLFEFFYPWLPFNRSFLREFNRCSLTKENIHKNQWNSDNHNQGLARIQWITTDDDYNKKIRLYQICKFKCMCHFLPDKVSHSFVIVYAHRKLTMEC